MIVPDGIVQAERLVALAPAVAGPFVLFDDDRRHTELAKARAERDAALAAADDDDLGLDRIAEFRGLDLALFLPGFAIPVMAVFGPHRTAKTLGLFMALQLRHGGEQRPDQAVLEADMAIAAGDAGLEFEPAVGDAVGLRGGLLRVLQEVRGLGGAKLAGQHVADLLVAFQRLQVPGECYQVAPVAIGLKQVDRGVDVAAFQRLPEL